MQSGDGEEMGNVGLGEILILGGESLRHGDIVGWLRWTIHGGKKVLDDGVETAADAGADVEGPLDGGGLLGEGDIDASDIGNMDEIAALFAIAIAPGSGKKAGVTGLEDLMIKLMDHGGHPPFMAFTGTVDVEIT